MLNAIVWRVLQHQAAAGQVDGVQRGGLSAGVGVAIRTGNNLGAFTGIRAFGGVSHRTVYHYFTGFDVDAKAGAVGCEHAQFVGHRVEVDDRLAATGQLLVQAGDLAG